MAKESKTVAVHYRKHCKNINRPQYESDFTKRIDELETIGIVVQDIYFSKSSESVYVTFTLGNRNENRLNLKGKRYIGQFAISSHERFYDTTIRTFKTQKAKDANDLFKQILQEMNTALAYENKISQYVVTIEERELEALRIIDKLGRQKRGLEVEHAAFVKQKNFPVFYMEYGYKQILKLIEDKATNAMLLSLRYKGCIQDYNEGINSRGKVTLTSIGKQMLLQYGEDPSDTLWREFCLRKTFDLWDNDLDSMEVEEDTSATIDVPVDEELTKLKISEDWYTAFDLLFYKLQKKEALVKDEKFLWKELLGSFIESHLPETQEFIHVGFVPSSFLTTIFIGEDSDLEGATIYGISCAKEVINTSDYISISYSGKRPVTFLSSIVEWINADHSKYQKSFSEDDLRCYLQLKFLEQSKVGLTTTEYFLNSDTTMKLSAQAIPIYMEQRLKKKITYSPALEDENITRMFKLLCKLSKNQAIIANPTDKKRIRLITTGSSDAIFRYVESEMLYVRDNIMYEDKAEYPIVQDVEKGLITYINVASLLSVQ